MKMGMWGLNARLRLLVSLRGINLTPNSEPEDMVSIRIWMDKNCIISTRCRKFLTIEDIALDMTNGNGPSSPAQFIVSLTEKLISSMTDTIEDIEDNVSQIEDSILTTSTFSLRSDIGDLRRRIISLRRYLSPQREAMVQLQSEKIKLFSNDDRIQLRETTDHWVRFIEDIDSIRDRAAVSQEELHSRLTDQLNNKMFFLSIFTAIFLPLGFLTGLLGINVGGIPGASNTNAFSIFLLFLACIVIVQIWLLKKKKWF